MSHVVDDYALAASIECQCVCKILGYLFIIFFDFLKMCMDVLPACM